MKMTKKRFSETERNCYYTSLVFDNQTQEELGTNKVVDLLNELYGENKKLKKELRGCANNWKQEIVKRGKLEEEIMKMRDYYESQTSTRED